MSLTQTDMYTLYVSYSSTSNTLCSEPTLTSSATMYTNLNSALFQDMEVFCIAIAIMHTVVQQVYALPSNKTK